MTDDLGVDTVKVLVILPNGSVLFNESMTQNEMDEYFYLANFSANGTYLFQIWANDTSGYANVSGMHSFVILNQSYRQVNLSIVSGWNLITVPVDTGWNASDLASHIPGCISVSRWDQNLQSYRAYFVGGPDTFDFVVSWGMGLFVEVDTESIWYGEG